MLFQPPDPRLLKGGESLFVRFWGTRGSIAVPGERTAKYGGNTSCVEVRTDDGTIIVLDCGTGARELGHHLLQSAPQPLRIHLFIGHTHWDHIQGFPFFGPAFHPNTELNIYAHSGDEEYAGKSGWGHSTVEYATDVALAAGSSRLALFHHDPAHDDATVARLEVIAQDRAAARGPALEVFAAAEGLELHVRGSRPSVALGDVTAIRRPPVAGKRVLVISSSETEIAAIGHLLADGNLVLLPTSSKRTALECAPGVSPDLAIIDGRLSDGLGVELIQPLRARLDRPDFPIILLTNEVTLQSDLRVSGMPPTDCLTKPFSTPMLRARVLAWLTRALPPGRARADETISRGIPKPAPPPRVPGAEAARADVATAASYADTLAMMPLFRSLDRERLLRLVSRASEHVFTAGNAVIRQGETANHVFVVLSGLVRVVQSTFESPLVGQVLAEIGYGEVFGELAMLTDQPRTATVVAVEHTRCLALAPDDFMQVLQRSPDMAIGLLRALAWRLTNADRLLARYAPDPLTG